MARFLGGGVPRVPEAEIERLKQEVSLGSLAEAAGEGRGWGW
jgi:hypothetical protein